MKMLIIFAIIILNTCLFLGRQIPAVSIKDLKPTDFTGIWEAKYYGPHDGTEKLEFKEDGTYQQKYEDTQGYSYTSDWNKWYMEKKQDGSEWLHLENGLWFPHGPKIALLRGMDPADKNSFHWFYDYSTNDSVQMKNELILIVRIASTAKGFMLSHFAYDIDTGVEHFFPAQ